MNLAQRKAFFARLAELNPAPRTELEYRTPFELLIAVMLSAQATDVSVNKATRRLYPVANTAAAVLALGEEGLKRSEEHTSELQSLMRISYAVFCLKKKT